MTSRLSDAHSTRFAHLSTPSTLPADLSIHRFNFDTFERPIEAIDTSRPRLVAELQGQFTESVKVVRAKKANWGGLGYGG